MEHCVLTLGFVLEYNCFLPPKPLGPFSRPAGGICGWKTDGVLNVARARAAGFRLQESLLKFQREPLGMGSL